MKKFKFLVALLLVLCFAITCFAGCGGSEEVDDEKETQKDDAPDDVQKPSNSQTATAEFDDRLMMEPVGVIDKNDFTVCDGGLLYRNYDTGKYGIISVDGTVDSGEIYCYAEQVDAYFQVMSKSAANADDIAGINTFALVTGDGQQVIAPGYVSYVTCGDFVVAYKATARNDEDGFLCFLSESDVLGTESATTARYDCKWEVYHLGTGKKVPGVAGDGEFSGYDDGSILWYESGDDFVPANAYGNITQAYDELFTDGSYSVEDRVGEVFAADGTKLFTYELSGFVPYRMEGGYYLATRYEDGEATCVVLDKTGKAVSAVFPDITLVGNLILCGGAVFNYQGEVVLEGSYYDARVEGVFGKYYAVCFEDRYVLFDESGNVYLDMTNDDDHYFNMEHFVAGETQDDGTMYFCHKTKKFEIQGHSVMPWMIESSGAGFTYDLVDTITGDTILSGYNRYKYVACDNESYYVYAVSNRTTDVFLVTSFKEFQPVTDMKEDLLQDLSDAFESAGINVTINRETGEMSLDSSVLFGGDSSKLTEEGKQFLNTFISVYSSVAFSDKYEGFISITMIEGHTAPVAGSTYESGLELSQERAANVKAYILSGETGVDLSAKADSFSDVGRSNSQPVYNEDGSVNMAASRRVSFRFLVNVSE